MDNNASKIVSSAVLGMDMEVVLVGGKRYVLFPPTINKIAGVGYALSSYSDGDMNTVVKMMTNIGDAAKALSYLVAGDESLVDEFSQAPLEEIIEALKTGISLISVENFIVLSGLARNVAALIAKQRP